MERRCTLVRDGCQVCRQIEVVVRPTMMLDMDMEKWTMAEVSMMGMVPRLGFVVGAVEY